jgi:GxxExxY protein
MLNVATNLSAELEDLIHRTIGCCITVHRELGPGLIESVYHRAVGYELGVSGIPFEREKACPINYRGRRLYTHRLDLVVAGELLLELKAVERLHPVHVAQVLSSLRASKLPVALLINFNVALLPQGIRRVVGAPG